MIITTINEDTSKIVYRKINSMADSNSFIQGLSGVFGFPATILVDGAVIFTHYGPMINEIRQVYGRTPLDTEKVVPIVKAISSEILFDLIVDKVLGQIPIAGIYFNAICAKAMTWRLGMLFSVLSSIGDDIDTENMVEIMKLIRIVTPQEDVFKFSQPRYEIFEKLLLNEI